MASVRIDGLPQKQLIILMETPCSDICGVAVWIGIVHCISLVSRCVSVSRNIEFGDGDTAVPMREPFPREI